MNKCSKCKNIISKDILYCPVCGQKVELNKVNSTNKRKNLIIGLSVITVLIIGFIIYNNFYKNSYKDVGKKACEYVSIQDLRGLNDLMPADMKKYYEEKYDPVKLDNDKKLYKEKMEKENIVNTCIYLSVNDGALSSEEKKYNDKYSSNITFKELKLMSYNLKTDTKGIITNSEIIFKIAKIKNNWYLIGSENI